MQLPILWPEIPGQKFECRACTRCCRELVVHLTRADREKIDRQKWGGRLDSEPYVRLGNAYILNQKSVTVGSTGGCVFLMEDGRCRIHAEYGRTEKPLACQLYPFTVEEGAAGAHVGLRYDCPTTAASAGLPLATHRQDIKRIAAELHDAGAIGKTKAHESIEVARGVRIASVEVDRFVEHVERWLRSDHPLQHRLIGLERLAHTLSEAKLQRLDADTAAELVVMLAGGIEELGNDDSVAAPRDPSAREMRLFRQAVFSHCEHATFQQMFHPLFATVRHRWSQLVRARRMSRGAGSTPMLTGIAGRADFEAVDRIAPAGPEPGQIDAGVESLVTRYLLARIESRTVFGGGYYGWSIADGMSALLLAVACAGWLARLHAAVEHREMFNRVDAERAIAIVDRASGRAPELGARSARFRVRYLGGASAISALLTKYRMSKKRE
ncbi:MAG TPA: YkgJ family cysteine cluster protein [Phycisphaerae bacterium]|nr:YkgJ family cysteine cluster protein [Phycisphaerae bacterium]